MNDTSATDKIDAVLRNLEAAAAIVRSGKAVSVRVSGLAYGEQLLPAAQALAVREGVEVDPMWWNDDEGCDILVRLGDGEDATDAIDD